VKGRATCRNCQKFYATSKKCLRRNGEEKGLCPRCGHGACLEFQDLRKTCIKELTRSHPFFRSLFEKHGWPDVLEHITDEQIFYFAPVPKIRQRRLAKRMKAAFDAFCSGKREGMSKTDLLYAVLMLTHLAFPGNDLSAIGSVPSGDPT
jgi:hypothetical protein